MIAKGEVDIDAVREKFKKLVGEENIDLVADAYADAYEKTNMTADEIWEECICDSLGDMNIFANVEKGNPIIQEIMAQIKETTEDTKTAPNKTRGAPKQNVTKYSLNEFEDDQRFVIVETNQELFDGLSAKEKIDLATQIIKQRFQGKVIGIDNRVFVNGNTVDELTHPVKHLDSDVYEAKLRATSELDNLVDAGFNFRNVPDGQDGHTHPDVVGGFDHFDVIFKVGKEYYQGLISIKNIKRGKLLKDITKIKNITNNMTSRYGESPSYAFVRDVSMNSISQNSDLSTQNSKIVKKTSRELDTDYLSAVERGDMETAQRRTIDVRISDKNKTKAATQVATFRKIKY